MTSKQRIIVVLLLLLAVAAVVFYKKNSFIVGIFKSNAVSGLSIALTVSPEPGMDPVPVTLTGTVTSDTEVPLTAFKYFIWFDCSDPVSDPDTAPTVCGLLPSAPPPGQCAQNDIGMLCDALSPIPPSITFIHAYPMREQSYTPKIIVVAETERGQALSAETRTTLNLPPPTPTPTPEPTIEPTPTDTPTEVATPEISPTDIPPAIPAESATPVIEPTITVIATAIPSVTPTQTPTITPTATPTSAPDQGGGGGGGGSSNSGGGQIIITPTPSISTSNGSVDNSISSAVLPATPSILGRVVMVRTGVDDYRMALLFAGLLVIAYYIFLFVKRLVASRGQTPKNVRLTYIGLAPLYLAIILLIAVLLTWKSINP